MTSLSPDLVPAAEYLRVSSNMQRGSIAGQQAEIAAFALVAGYRIVRTYADPGRSGLRLAGRPGLQQLLADVLGGRADFQAILVQDVSRWGRFQDPDEAAHYEFVCRELGIEVRYCSDSLEAAGSPVAGILKAVRRLMAAEFSRELSGKTRRAHRRWIQAGYKMGGSPGYGLRRRLVGADGVRKGLLGPGENKVIHTERVVLELGPAEEVATVRRIYRLYLDDGLNLRAIARRLNAEGVAGPSQGVWRPWTVAYLLSAEKYAGDSVYGRKPRDPAGGRGLTHDPDLVRIRGTWPAIVSRAQFDAAQAKRRRAKLFLSEDEMLRRAAALLAERGALTTNFISATPDLPNPQTYRAHFGPLNRLCARLGAYPSPPLVSADPCRFLPGHIDSAGTRRDVGAQTESALMSQTSPTGRYTAFGGDRRIGAGDLSEVAIAAKAAHDAKIPHLLVFDDTTGAVVELDYRGDAEDVLARLPRATAATEDEAPAVRGRGRPRLGVSAREVTLLPRHWTWLASQPGGASATLRKLVEQASRANADLDAARAAQTAAYKAMYALAGHRRHFEEALRAMYAPDRVRFSELIGDWPQDVKAYVSGLADLYFDRQDALADRKG